MLTLWLLRCGRASRAASPRGAVTIAFERPASDLPAHWSRRELHCLAFPCACAARDFARLCTILTARSWSFQGDLLLQHVLVLLKRLQNL